MGDIESVIKRIKERRLALNLSYQDVADITGLSKSTIQRYETGAIRKLPINQLEDIAKALHVSPGYLMGWESNVVEKQTLTKQEKELLAGFRNLNSQGKDTAAGAVKALGMMEQYTAKNVSSAS